MIIDFSQIPYAEFPKFFNGEKTLLSKNVVDDKNKIMSGLLVPGASIGLHTHQTNSEILFVTKGKGKVLYDGVYEVVSEGICHYCPKGHSHSLINDSDSDLTYFAVVTQQ